VTARERALRLLATRSHFRVELARKLAARGFPAEEIDAALAELAAGGYLDDARTAAELVAERRERQGWGRTRLRAELARRGAPPAAVATALEGIAGEDDLELARLAAARWSRRGAGQPGPQRAAALGRHLARKGFTHHAILAVLEEAGEAQGAGLEEAEADPAD
jgi:regulatory protein